MKKKYKTVLIDDEQNSIEAMHALIARYCPDLNIITSFNDPREALSFLQNNPVDLVFMDIQMPFMTGLDLMKELDSVEFHVIFTTAYDQYAIDAIKVSALDYLLKPVDPELLIKGVSRFIQSKSKFQESNQLSDVLATLENNTIKKIVIQLQEKTLFLDIEEILYLEADSNYTKFHMSDGKVHLTSKTIKYYQKHLESHHFFRPHQSYLVNAVYISEYNKSDSCIILSNDKAIPVSKNKKEALFQAMSRH